MKKTFPLFRVHVPSEQALANIKEVFDAGFINEGIQVTQLAEALKSVLKTKNIVLTNSCTSALTLALHVCHVRSGDEVISTPMTCVATNTPIVTMGAKIVWADIDPNDGMIDPADVEKKITSRTRAVIAVAWAGTPPKLNALKKICDAKGVKLILDAAHAFGATYLNSPLHEFSHFVAYSFQAIKHFTTGDGGALICADDQDHARSNALKWFGLDRDRAKDEKGDWKGQQWDVDITEAGFKFNMNNVAAAVGLAQLPHINDILFNHRFHAATYQGLLNDCSSIKLLKEPPESLSSHWVYTVKINPSASLLTRDELLKVLNDEGIMAGIVHVPNDTYTAFAGYRSDLPGVRAFSETQFSLPCGWWLSYEDIRHIANRVRELTER